MLIGKHWRCSTLAIAALLMVISSACGKKAAKPPPPPQVAVVAVKERRVPLVSEWVGTLEGFINAQIQPRVSGNLLAQHYQEGTFVKEGTLLFDIDPRPFQAALEQARGQLLQAEAALGNTQITVKRLTPLARERVVSQQELDTAVQANLGNEAAVKAARANVTQAQLNLSFTKITSPIDGVVGIAQAQIGNLVGPATVLTTVSTLDPIKVYFAVSEQEYLNYVKQNPTPGERATRREQAQLELILADGSVYPRKGKIVSADRQVNPQTGTLRIDSVFPNPGNILRPGQFARVRAVTAVLNNALLVPQRAVQELQGTHQIAVVGPDNKVQIRSVEVGSRIGPDWIITAGLKPGERVIAEGTQKVRNGMVVTPRAFAADDQSAQAAQAQTD